MKRSADFRMVAKMIKDLEKAEEVFINTKIFEHEVNQMVQSPLVLFNSSTNTISIQSVDEGYGDITFDLAKDMDLQWERNGDTFTYWIEFNKFYEVTITNEW